MSDIIFIWLYRIVSGLSFFVLIPFFVLEYEKGNLNTLIDINQYVVIFSILDGILITGLSRYLRANISDARKTRFAIAFIFYVYSIIALSFSLILYITDFRYLEFVLAPILLLPFRVVISYYFAKNKIGKLKKAEAINSVVRLCFLCFLINQSVELSIFILCYTLTPSLVYLILYFHDKLYKHLFRSDFYYSEIQSIIRNNISGLFFTVPWVVFSTNAILSISNEQLYSTESKLLLSIFIAYMGFLGAFDMSLTPKIMNKDNESKNKLFWKYLKYKSIINFISLGVFFTIPSQFYNDLLGDDVNSDYIKESLSYFSLFFMLFVSHSGLLRSYIISTNDYLVFSVFQGAMFFVFYLFSNYAVDVVSYFVHVMALKSLIDISYFLFRFRGSFLTS